jgi:DNA-directed RNA polymerase
MYTSRSALNMQGGELARGLIMFSKGEVLNDNGLRALKVYTANAFGLDKKSKKHRID